MCRRYLCYSRRHGFTLSMKPGSSSPWCFMIENHSTATIFSPTMVSRDHKYQHSWCTRRSGADGLLPTTLYWRLKGDIKPVNSTVHRSYSGTHGTLRTLPDSILWASSSGYTWTGKAVFSLWCFICQCLPPSCPVQRQGCGVCQRSHQRKTVSRLVCCRGYGYHALNIPTNVSFP